MHEAKLALLNFVELPESEMLLRANDYKEELQKRRTVRDFSSKHVSMEVIKSCLLAAGSAPSGANKQPWKFAVLSNGEKSKNYYTHESVGIATGILISALHHSGLVSLTHTPSPMSFLNKILDRPGNERPFMILVAGYPKEGVCVPAIKRKHLDEISIIK